MLDTDKSYLPPRPHFITVASFHESIPVNDGLSPCTSHDSECGEIDLHERLDNAVQLLHKSKSIEGSETFFLITLGDACKQNKDYTEALRLYKDCLPLVKEMRGEQHVDVADLLSSIGFVLEKKMKHNASLVKLEEALQIYKKVSKDESLLCDEKKDPRLKMINVCNQIGNILFRKGEFDGALDYYRQALGVTTKVIPERAASKSSNVRTKVVLILIAETLNNIASVQAEKGERHEALKSYNQAFALQVEALGEDDPAVANTLNNIGTLNYRIGRYQLALKSYKQVLKMRRHLFGQLHETVSDILVNIGLVFTKLGDYDNAERAYLEGHRVTLAVLGKNHIKLALLYENLGSLAQLQNKNEMAKTFLEKAKRVFKANGIEDNHPFVAKVKDDLAYLNKDTVSGFFDQVYSKFSPDVFCGGFCVTSPYEQSVKQQ